MVFVLRLRSWDLSWTWKIGHNYLNKQGSRKVEHCSNAYCMSLNSKCPTSIGRFPARLPSLSLLGITVHQCPREDWYEGRQGGA